MIEPEPMMQVWCAYSALRAIGRRAQRLAIAEQRAATEVWEAWWTLALYARAAEVDHQLTLEERDAGRRSKA